MRTKQTTTATRDRSVWMINLIGLMSLMSLIGVSCEDLPKNDYEAFKDRAEEFWPEVVDSDDLSSQLSDLRGRWLLRAQLNAGLQLGLRVEIASEEWPERLGPDDEPFPFNAKIWLDSQDPDVDDPLVIVAPTPEINHEGRFTLTADPLVLDAETLPVTLSVSAIVDLESVTIDADRFCGVATGSVTEPLTIDLEGSTFNAVRDDELALTRDDIESVKCPEEEMAGESAGESAGENAGEPADATP